MSNPDDDKTIVLGNRAAAPSRPARGGSVNALPIGTHLFEFEIVGLVGEGGFGIVYLADDHSLQRRVAIKEYMPSSLAMRGEDASVIVRSDRHADTFEIGRRSFVNEARLLAQFDHPALLKVYRFWEANGTAYMAMPYYAGKTLRDVLRERQGPPPDEAWLKKILGPVMDALELMHAENCYHRDVAPDNIMLLRDERPVLLDFGAARRVISDMTQALTVILKPGYAPIEQYAEMPGVKQGPWTDIYALAAVVYFTITGRTPPPAVGRMLQDGYEPVATLAAGRYSEQFLTGIDHCMQVKGEERPQSIVEMRELLGMTAYVSIPSPASSRETASGANKDPGVLETLTPSSTPVSTTHVSQIDTPPRTEPTPITRKRRGVTTYAAGATMAGAVALVGAFIFARKAPPQPEQPATAPAPATVSAPPAVVPSLAPPTPLPVAPTTRQVTLEEAFVATVAASDTRFGLKIDKIRSPLAIGKEALSFVLHTERSGLLYVLLWDKAASRLSQIFPNELDRSNRIAAGKPLAFPRPDWAYEADQPKGSWEVITIVADSPRDFSVLRFDPASSGAPQKIVEAALTDSGKGPLGLGGEARCADGQPCSPAFAALRFSVEEILAAERKDKEVAKLPGLAPTPRDKPAAKGAASNEQAEKHYVKELNKSLDKLLDEK
ncbi:serine/threonine protein kinase [Zoogloea sp.]|uniref:serine/threonine protein kinase n=1 Tax=Zoogloea sp. TaxID=49181 RepID=UPI0035B304E5